MFTRKMFLSAVLALLITPAFVKAQQSSGQNRDSNRGDRSSSDRGGDRGNRGGFDPARMREYIENRAKEQLNPSEDEWKVIQPKLDKVIDARRDSSSFGGMFRRRDDSGSSSSEDTNRSPVQKATRDLQQTLDNKDATADEIAKKLATLREAKEKSKAELATAQKDLKEVLTQRQEAVLVMMGMLD